MALEVGAAAVEVDEPSGKEPARLEEYETDAPGAAPDGQLAVAALGLTAGGALGSIDPRQAPVRRAAAGHPLQGFAVSSYTARIRVEEEGGGSRVHWESEFEPVDPASGPELAEASHSFYRTGLEHLRGLVEGA